MKHIFLNLKRFDIPRAWGGVNDLAEISRWGGHIVSATQEGLKGYDPAEVEFVQFYPEAHLLGAVQALCPDSPIQVGCQGVHRADTAVGGNIGAFTTLRTANAARALGCAAALIGHCEERADKKGVLAEAGVADSAAVGRLLNQEILCAQAAGLRVLYCVGENAEEQENWQEVLGQQLDTGLAGADRDNTVIAYEPVWSIGPGKTPAGPAYITKIARFIKERTGGMDVVYGGGLKTEDAGMLASIPEIDGGLIALTAFSGQVGFYPGQYLDIIRTYWDGIKEREQR